MVVEPYGEEEFIELQKDLTKIDGIRMMATVQHVADQALEAGNREQNMKTLLAVLAFRQGGRLMIRQAEIKKLPKEFDFGIGEDEQKTTHIIASIPRDKIVVVGDFKKKAPEIQK